MRWFSRWVLLCAFVVIPFAASPGQAQPVGYGETTFETSGDPAAQEVFLQGLLMLHSFEYADARSAFQEAQSIDPDFAMAHWGEAMTHNHPLWYRQDREAAVAALAELGATRADQVAKAPTAREKAYLSAVHVLYGVGEDEPAGKEARDDAYAEAMADVAAAYPDDLDAQAFHALAILGTAHEGRDVPTYMRAAAIVEEVFDANPKHPGAAHYLIHAYDDPVHAPLGLRPARIYADLAPSASHALHMPSHIFVSLGMWDRGGASNVDSYEAAKAATVDEGEPLNGHGYHALHWLAYIRLQQGRYDDAREVVATGQRHAAADGASDVGYTRYVASTFPMMYVVESERWDAVDAFTVEVPEDAGHTAATVHATRGMAVLAQGDRAGAEAALQKAEAAVAEAEKDAHRLPVLQLQALLAHDAGDAEAAVALLDEAASIEDAMPLSYGPPTPIKPTHELYGEVLLAMDRPAEAQAQFEKALDRNPKRALSLFGRAKAAAQAGDAEAFRESRTALSAMWDDADPAVAARLDALPAMEEAMGAKGGG